LAVGAVVWVSGARFVSAQSAPVDTAADDAAKLFNAGRQIFRFDTFGDEAFWGDTLKLHQAIQGSALGGVGGGLSPKAALGLGLKVDAAVVPADLAAQIKSGQLSLLDPANTVALIKLNAVVGITGFFDNSGGLTSIGIQCALCHSTVDNSFLPGIGKRLDGWPNRDLDRGRLSHWPRISGPWRNCSRWIRILFVRCCEVGVRASTMRSWCYRTAPLAGLFAHQTGGYYHDGRFTTLDSVLDHYDRCKGLGLSSQDRSDLIQYLLSI
jgi:hypothetical protein